MKEEAAVPQTAVVCMPVFGNPGSRPPQPSGEAWGGVTYIHHEHSQSSPVFKPHIRCLLTAPLCLHKHQRFRAFYSLQVQVTECTK